MSCRVTSLSNTSTAGNNPSAKSIRRIQTIEILDETGYNQSAASHAIAWRSPGSSRHQAAGLVSSIERRKPCVKPEPKPFRKRSSSATDAVARWCRTAQIASTRNGSPSASVPAMAASSATETWSRPISVSTASRRSWGST